VLQIMPEWINFVWMLATKHLIVRPNSILVIRMLMISSENATVDAALEALKLKDLGSYLDGMAITLLPHQIIGVAWMLKMEEKSCVLDINSLKLSLTFRSFQARRSVGGRNGIGENVSCSYLATIFSH
jgi:hypothetical protein